MDKYSIFLRKNIIFKPGEIDSKIINLDDFIPCQNSILHLIDNFINDENYISDMVEIQKFPFISSKLKYGLYSNRELTPYKLPDYKAPNIRLINTDLTANLRNAEKQLLGTLKNYKTRSLFDQFIKSRSNIGLINHNPLFRIKLTGISPKYRNIAIWYNIYKNLSKEVKNYPAKNNFIFIPVLNNRLVQRVIFQGILSIDKIPEAYLDKIDYLSYLLSHILGYITGKSFSYITDTELNFVFFNPESRQAMIFNTMLLKDLNEKSSLIKWRFINSIYRLSLNRKIDIDNIEKDIETDIEVKSATSKSVVEQTDFIKAADNVSIVTSSKLSYTQVDQLMTVDINSNNTSVELDTILKTEKSKERYTNLLNKSINMEIELDGKKVKIKDIVEKELSDDIADVIDISEKIDESVMDKSYAKSNIVNYNQGYMKERFNKDMLTVLLSFQKHGMVLTKYKEENTKTDINLIKKVSVQFTNIDGKVQTIHFEFPMPDEEGAFIYSGTKSYMKKQFVNLPIIKLSAHRVSLSSNYGKLLVERNPSIMYNYGNYILKQIIKHNKHNPKNEIVIVRQSKIYNDIDVPYDYSSVAQYINTIKNSNGLFTFKYEDRYILDTQKTIDILEKKYKGIVIGKSKENDILYLMTSTNIVHLIDIETKKILNDTFLVNLILPIEYQSIKPEWVNVYLLDKKLPLIAILGYRYGLTNILKYIDIPYRLVPKGRRLNLTNSEIPIRFIDFSLVIPRYPITKSWIVAGLLYFNYLNILKYSELDSKEGYYSLFETKGLSINYLKGIDNLYNFFIDPLTEQILERINEPTNIRDLFIRAVELLNITSYKPSSSLSNFKINGLEKMNGILYNVIARQYAQYLNDKSKNTAFSINTKAVVMSILQDQAVVLVEETNPVQFVKERTALTHSGFLGRSSVSFVDRDIAYPSDGLGLLSEATPDSGKVGFNAYSPIDTIIKDQFGLLDFEQQENIGSGQMLSSTAVLMPFMSNDSPKRVNFVNIQLAHHVPSKNASPTRVRTGFESVLGNFTGVLYALHAKQDGKVLDINDKHKILKIQYKDESIYAYRYGEQAGRVSDISIVQTIDSKVKKGQSFKKNDLLLYNPGFFTIDPITEQLNWNHGVQATLAIIDKDATLEDSSGFTQEFLDKFNIDVIYDRVIRITDEYIIKKLVKEGDHVKYNTPLSLIEFAEFEDLEFEEVEDSYIIDQLKRIDTLAKYNGEVVYIKCYYTGALDNYHASIQKVIKSYIRKNNAIKKIAGETSNPDKTIIQSQVPVGSRIGKLTIDENEVLIIVGIKTQVKSSVGDKFVIDGALKTVPGEVVTPLKTESGINIDGIFGGNSLFDRVILSPFKLGILENILEHIEKTAIEMYEDK